MLYELALPKLIPNMSEARVEAVHVTEGEAPQGGKLLDLSVDLGDVASQACPPISYYRLVTREKARLLRLLVPLGGTCAPGAPLALFADDPGDDPDGAPARALRASAAAILWRPDMWSAQGR